jgi:hypothetical protein
VAAVDALADALVADVDALVALVAALSLSVTSSIHRESKPNTCVAALL